MVACEWGNSVPLPPVSLHSSHIHIHTDLCNLSTSLNPSRLHGQLANVSHMVLQVIELFE